MFAGFSDLGQGFEEIRLATDTEDTALVDVIPPPTIKTSGPVITASLILCDFKAFYLPVPTDLPA